MSATDLNLKEYIQYLIDEGDVCKADMYDYILKNGERNIIKLNYMLKDTDEILFCIHNDFMEEEEENINKRIKEMQEKCIDLPIKKQWTLNEHLEYVKTRPHFKEINEKQRENLINWVTEHHRDITIDKEKLVGYDWEYHNVRIFRELIFSEVERLKKQLENANNYTEMNKIKLEQYLRDLTSNNVEDFYTQKIQEYLYYMSDTVTMENGETIPKGVSRFLMNLPENRQGDPNIKGTVKMNGKTVDGFEINEKYLIEREMSDLKELAKDVDLIHDVDLRCKFEYYNVFLEKRLEKTENIDSKRPKQITIQDNSIRQFTEEQLELLKSYFSHNFKRKICGINYFDDNLVIDLKKNRVGIEYAKIAKMIYESPKSEKEFKDKPFSQWYETFCNIMGIEVKTYKPSQILIDDNIKCEFYYLA